MKQPVIIGSRGSDLALWQANYTRQMLLDLGVESEIRIIKTQGDKIQHLGFDKMEGKGFFTKEIEAALLSGEIDLAVHSHKDLETRSPEGLVIAAVSERANPNEYLLIRPEAHDPLMPLELKKDAVVGTSAARRKAQLKSTRPDFHIKDLRGNVPTRIDKLRQGNYDAILVARAGVDRLELNLSEFIVNELDPRKFVPAPAQGVLAFQVRADDHELIALLDTASAKDVADETEAERSVLRLMDGGCQVPYGAHAVNIDDEELHFWSFYAQKDGSQSRRIFLNIPPADFSDARMLNLLQEKRSETVLITREMNTDGLPLRMLQDAGLTLVQQSFIEILPVAPPQQNLSAVQWLFFTSANAVAHFPYYDELNSDVRFAAVGSGTLRALQQKGISPDFVGMGAPDEVGAVFSAELGASKAMVVCGKNGLRNVQKALRDDQFEECEVYETRLRPQTIEQPFDVIAFTSPSNVRAFLQENTIPESTRVVSIGKSTAAALHEFDIDSIISWESSEQALADTILGALY